MAGHYVLVHGAWHTGAEMEAVATHLREKGYTVHCPTVTGNNPNDDREKTGLEDAIGSIVSYIEANDLRDVRLIGHRDGLAVRVVIPLALLEDGVVLELLLDAFLQRH